jgi:hypothetical protein
MKTNLNFVCQKILSRKKIEILYVFFVFFFFFCPLMSVGIVRSANELLSLCGIDLRVTTPRDCTSSMLVAALESVLRLRLPGITRRPRTRADLVNNAAAVLAALGRGEAGWVAQGDTLQLGTMGSPLCTASGSMLVDDNALDSWRVVFFRHVGFLVFGNHYAC